MLFVLAGPSYVGKKTALSHFMKLYSFSSIIPYTTKPMEKRNGEVEGIKYHYVAQKDSKDIENNNYIYDRPFQCKEQDDNILYAYKKYDIKNAIDGYANFIIHASVGNAIKIYDEYHKDNQGHLYIIFLDFYSELDKDFFKEKFMEKNSTGQIDDSQNTKIDIDEFERRFNHAKKERNTYLENKQKFDICVKADHKYEICEKLENEILPKLMVMPTSPERIPGALSDIDIIYMSENRKSEMLEVSINNRKLQGEELKQILCGCGIQLTLSSTIRLIKKNLLHNYIDMADSEVNLEAQLARLYPEQNISTGYILKPNETILCSSEERIKIPYDVFAIVSSKFSYTQLGLSIELGTSIIQSGHCGKVHFQIKNNTENCICIYPHIQVVQLLFFRMVQPSSCKYSESSVGHSYDLDSVPPISKFRKGNDTLVHVSKPAGNWLKSILVSTKENLIIKIVGFIFVIVGMIFNIAKIENFLNIYLVPFITSSSVLMQCLIVAVIGSVLTHLFDIVGRLLCLIGRNILMNFREHMR